jgi:plasmid stability protein
MTSMTIRRLDDGLKARLRLQAAQHGRSMEEEAREILREGLARKPAVQSDLAESIRRYIAPLGGVELPALKRERVRRPPRLTK